MKYTADELKPKRYPQDTPSEDGRYLAITIYTRPTRK